MNIGVTPAKLNEIIDKVWKMTLRFRIKPIKSELQRPEPLDLLLASVTISGAWQGVLTLGCSTCVARSAAAAMFGKPAVNTNPEEIRDALGELTNMVGGNVKTMLKGDCRLSVPRIVDTIPCDHPEPMPVEYQWFECEGGVVVLHLIRLDAVQ